MIGIGSVKEDLTAEKRISITPETVKRLIDLNLSVFIEESYGEHWIRNSKRDIGT